MDAKATAPGCARSGSWDNVDIDDDSDDDITTDGTEDGEDCR